MGAVGVVVSPDDLVQVQVIDVRSESAAGKRQRIVEGIEDMEACEKDQAYLRSSLATTEK